MPPHHGRGLVGVHRPHHEHVHGVHFQHVPVMLVQAFRRHPAQLLHVAVRVQPERLVLAHLLPQPVHRVPAAVVDQALDAAPQNLGFLRHVLRPENAVFQRRVQQGLGQKRHHFLRGTDALRQKLLVGHRRAQLDLLRFADFAHVGAELGAVQFLHAPGDVAGRGMRCAPQHEGQHRVQRVLVRVQAAPQHQLQPRRLELVRRRDVQVKPLVDGNFLKFHAHPRRLLCSRPAALRTGRPQGAAGQAAACATARWPLRRGPPV